MENIPNVWLNEKNYENVGAICPFCGHSNKYNRASDLQNISIINNKIVQCENIDCQKSFQIIGDIVNPAYELLIFDCYKLKDEKRYSFCILNLAQSFEMFFALYLRVELLYKPFAQEGSRDPFHFKKVQQNLENRTKDYTFHKMRNLFLNYIVLTMVLMKRPPNSLLESETILSQLTTDSPKREILLQVEDSKFVQLLMKISVTEIGNIRNKVVHKTGYRPTIAKVESALAETEEIIYGLLPFLGILTDQYNIYRMGGLKNRDL